MKLKQKLIEFLSLDYRSLALMRFTAGLVIILDLIDRSKSLVAHYSDGGVLSRVDALTKTGNAFFVSVHMISGLPIVELALFCIAGVFALMLMFGYRTKLATIVSWFLLISLQARNSMVLQGADVVFRVALFWMMFLPTGKRWSLDRLLNRTPRVKEKTIASPATLAYITQIVLMYTMSGVLKTGLAWQDGTAVYYALSIDQLVRPLGEHLRSWTAATHFLTHATLTLERYGSILYFSPLATGFFRTVAIVLFAGMQIGFNLSMPLGLFGIISIMITLGLIPSYFWDVWVKRVRLFFIHRAKTGLSIYYDANCGFCFKMVHVLKNFLLLSDETVLASADTDSTAAEIMERENSWVVIDHQGKSHVGFSGFALVFSYSPLFAWLTPLFRLPIISDLGEYCYRLVAQKRLLVCLPETEMQKEKGAFGVAVQTLQNIVLIFLTFYIIAWNVNSPTIDKLIPNTDWIAWTTRLDQRFDMFAPTPLTEDGWYVIPATLQDGTRIDLFKDGPMLTGKTFYPVSYKKPEHVAYGYPDQRWQKYLMNIAESDNSQYRLGYGQYLCRTWNATHWGGQTLMSFDITYMIENTPPPDTAPTPPVLTNLWSHHCF